MTFDLVNSPLLEARIGRGRIVLCQVDVTSRYATDPVSTQLVNNLLNHLPRSSQPTLHQCVCIGDSAVRFLKPFGISGRPAQFFLGRVTDDPLLTGLNDGDLVLNLNPNLFRPQPSWHGESHVST